MVGGGEMPIKYLEYFRTQVPIIRRQNNTRSPNTMVTGKFVITDQNNNNNYKLTARGSEFRVC